jgi:hypothetical protein
MRDVRAHLIEDIPPAWVCRSPQIQLDSALSLDTCCSLVAESLAAVATLIKL